MFTHHSVLTTALTVVHVFISVLPSMIYQSLPESMHPFCLSPHTLVRTNQHTANFALLRLNKFFGGKLLVIHIHPPPPVSYAEAHTHTHRDRHETHTHIQVDTTHTQIDTKHTHRDRHEAHTQTRHTRHTITESVKTEYDKYFPFLSFCGGAGRCGK